MPANSELIDTLIQIEKEKGIKKEIIFEAIEASLIAAYKKNFGTNQNIKVYIDRERGGVTVFAQKMVVEEVGDEILEISLGTAKEIDIQYELGDIVDIEVTPRNFGRVSAQVAKEAVVRKFREAERDKLMGEFKDKEHEILTGMISRIESKTGKIGRNIFITVGKTDLLLAPTEQIPGENYALNQRIKVYVLEVKEGSRSPIINVSRTHPNLIRKLFEQEVPEVYEGLVEIKSIAREPGARTKIAVRSLHPNVDPVGSCVGANGARVNVIVNELNGEKIDIINYNEDMREYIAASLSPAVVLSVRMDEEEKSARIIVPDHQLSLAIGKEGQNARLAAKLTGFRIDIKSYSSAVEEHYAEQNNSEENENEQQQGEYNQYRNNDYYDEYENDYGYDEDN
ncbi:MAG: transcription termination factor NusA [Defluviitaleaceae bacterium]|nr:transcription termination factor NusA [Defluviitaleaceae bacterium]